MSALLPLFPLEVVLLPGALLPLHIFEPRYKEMIGECLEQKAEFGVVRVKEEEVSDLGCTAEVLKVIKQYDDGRMDIITVGRRRFEVMQLNHERSFLQADVIYVPDEPSSASQEQNQRIVELHKEILKLANADEPDYSELKQHQLSYELAGSLPIDLDFKQSLLAMKSEAERIPAIISFFEGIVPSLRHTAHVRRKAGGNGHAS